MKAISAHFDLAATVVDSLRAGADCFLACRDPAIQATTEDALDRAAARDAETRRRLDESAARLRALRATLLPQPARDTWKRIPLADHAALAERFRAA
jgi:beta-glucosidase-like glycosyl hydrolase